MTATDRTTADEVEQTILRGLIDRRVEVEGPDFDYADSHLITYARSVRTALERAGYRPEVDVLREAAEGLRKRERRLGERGMSSQFINGIHYAASALSARANELDPATALEQSLPLTSPAEDQERSEEKEHG